MLYVIYPEGIGKWVVNISNIHIDTYDTATQLILTVPAILQYPLCATCIYFIFCHLQTDKQISIGQALWYTAMRLHIIMITFIIYTIMIALGCVLFIFPGIYILGIFSMAIPGVMIDKLGVYKSFIESKKRTKGSVMYTLILLVLGTAIPSIFFSIAGPLLGLYIPNIIFNEIIIILSFMINAAIMVSTITFAYIELGLREQENTQQAIAQPSES